MFLKMVLIFVLVQSSQLPDVIAMVFAPWFLVPAPDRPAFVLVISKKKAEHILPRPPDVLPLAAKRPVLRSRLIGELICRCWRHHVTNDACQLHIGSIKRLFFQPNRLLAAIGGYAWPPLWPGYGLRLSSRRRSGCHPHRRS